jgi:hypothetical protein
MTRPRKQVARSKSSWRNSMKRRLLATSENRPTFPHQGFGDTSNTEVIGFMRLLSCIRRHVVHASTFALR